MPRSAVISLRHLEGVVVLCRCRSFSAAAKELSLTQSALTQAIAGIERRLQCRLFERNSRGARPTAAVEKLAASIQRAVDLLNGAGAAALPPSHRRPPLVRRASATQLLALTAVEKAGSFRRAARLSGLSEASVHRAVRAVEAALDAKLILSTATGVHATPAGIAICKAAREAQAELQSGFAACRSGAHSELLIGATPTLRAGLLSAAIAEMGKHDPSLRFRVEEANRPELFTALIDNKFDVLLCPQSTKVPDGVLQHAVFDEVLEVVARNGHALVNSSESLGLSALIGYPWIVHPAGTPRRAIWELLFRNAGLEPPLPWVECKSFEATRELLLRSEALAMVAPDQYRIEREQGLLTAIHPVASDQTRSIVIATRASWIPDAAEALLVQTLRKLGASHDRGHL